MKLLSKYNQITIAVTIGVMLITGIIYYYTISEILTNQIDKDLILEENEVFNYVDKNHHLPDVYVSNHQQITFRPIGKQKVPRRFLDSVYRETGERHFESGRALISSVKIADINYQILVIQSKVETEDLIRIIFFITISVIVVLLVILITLNRIILKRIWRPFYQILYQLKEFRLSGQQLINSVSSNTDEFKELNDAVVVMSERVTSDYQTLKAFTENASHEMMTPISVINSKLDTLVQTDDFTNKQSKLLNDIYGTVDRLTRLNRSMLLLSKIENGLIKNDSIVNLKELFQECLYQHEEIIQKYHLTVSVNLEDHTIAASRHLIEILINNLLSNAIKHNYENGHIKIILNNTELVIANSGSKTFDFDKALKRFHKSDESNGIGLGLTICKQICDNYNFRFLYTLNKDDHLFSVVF